MNNACRGCMADGHRDLFLFEDTRNLMSFCWAPLEANRHLAPALWSNAHESFRHPLRHQILTLLSLKIAPKNTIL